MLSRTRPLHAPCASLLRYKGEVVHFSSDAQTGLVRLVARLCGNTAGASSSIGAAAIRDEELGPPCRSARAAYCVPFSSKQVFASAAPLSADAALEQDASGSTATCIFPCYISCGCPAVVHVSPRYHDSSPSADEAASVSCAPPSLRVRCLYVYNPPGSKDSTHGTRRTTYYARLPDASFHCWQEHNQAVNDVLDAVKGRPTSSFGGRVMGLSSLDIEVLELLNLTTTLGCASGGCGTTSAGWTRNTSSEGTPGGVLPVPTL
ncbi:hypothetical protein LSCM1_03098 [Leishmania martiniquensis]|uniref:Uncharacterized protein n=1 Tax=Leishmania martiniquensis TaxID=1580590 RepID=A0A836H342_9TRYP|nr:hypothetical protein LSCM1_03098 [Leishmania martiniquensis]